MLWRFNLDARGGRVEGERWKVRGVRWYAVGGGCEQCGDRINTLGEERGERGEMLTLAQHDRLKAVGAVTQVTTTTLGPAQLL